MHNCTPACTSVCTAHAHTACLLRCLQVVPLARVKKMMKETQDVKIIAADASWLVARATVSPQPLQVASAHTYYVSRSQGAYLEQNNALQ